MEKIKRAGLYVLLLAVWVALMLAGSAVGYLIGRAVVGS